MMTAIHQLRKELHRYPELSGQEAMTAQRIENFVRVHHDTAIIRGLGGHGLAAIYRFSEEGPTIVIRCELDALPITEENHFEHRSVQEGISHKCGHDGHMAIVAGLIFWLKNQTFLKGKVVLLFQPAEENGRGAEAVLKDSRFRELRPNYVFALHNLPGEEKHTIIVTKEVFTATVQSIAIYLKGKQAHASEPENGINPALAMAELINRLAALNQPNPLERDFALLTPVYSCLGEKAYGISAGHGELHYTLRTWTEDAMQLLKNKLAELTEDVCQRYGLKPATKWFDYFPAVVNERTCNEVIQKVAAANGFPVKQKETPLRFGEDFGWFSKLYPTGMFGLGAGTGIPALHHCDYDFPDEIIDTGIGMFSGIIKELLAE